MTSLAELIYVIFDVILFTIEVFIFPLNKSSVYTITYVITEKKQHCIIVCCGLLENQNNLEQCIFFKLLHSSYPVNNNMYDMKLCFRHLIKYIICKI